MTLLRRLCRLLHFARGIVGQFVRNLVVTFSLPIVDIAREVGRMPIHRPVAPKLKRLTENPAGYSLSALMLRLVKYLTRQPLGSAAPLLSELQQIGLRGRRIVIGPWLSEVGFEVLYWIPFLQWAMREYNIDPERAVVISRGGVSVWYRHVGGRYVDMLDYFSADEIRALNERRISVSGHQKHMALGETDRVILDRICSTLDMHEYDVLHPSLMYQLLLPLWQRKAPPQLAHRYASYLPMHKPDYDLAPLALPQRYTAAKFYFSDAFPRTEDNIAKIRHMLSQYLRQGPVVLLTSGVNIDDHADLAEGLPEGLIVITPDIPAKNLLLQTAVVAGAERFIGTYGGFSYLAPLLGVPSLCVYSDLGRLMPMHMDVALRVFRKFACGSLEKGCVCGAVGESPSSRFTALHVDALSDFPSG